MSYVKASYDPVLERFQLQRTRTGNYDFTVAGDQANFIRACQLVDRTGNLELEDTLVLAYEELAAGENTIQLLVTDGIDTVYNEWTVDKKGRG